MAVELVVVFVVGCCGCNFAGAVVVVVVGLFLVVDGCGYGVLLVVVAVVVVVVMEGIVAVVVDRRMSNHCPMIRQRGQFLAVLQRFFFPPKSSVLDEDPLVSLATLGQNKEIFGYQIIHFPTDIRARELMRDKMSAEECEPNEQCQTNK